MYVFQTSLAVHAPTDAYIYARNYTRGVSSFAHASRTHALYLYTTAARITCVYGRVTRAYTGCPTGQPFGLHRKTNQG